MPGPINTDIVALGDVRPSRVAPKANSAAEGRAGANVQARSTQGMDPDEVGRLVLDGIQTDRFWIFTHGWTAKLLTRQLDALVADRSLSRA